MRNLEKIFKHRFWPVWTELDAKAGYQNSCTSTSQVYSIALHASLHPAVSSLSLEPSSCSSYAKAGFEVPLWESSLPASARLPRPPLAILRQAACLFLSQIYHDQIGHLFYYSTSRLSPAPTCEHRTWHKHHITFHF